MEFLVSTGEKRPDPDQLKKALADSIPGIEFSEGGAREALWTADFVNPETLVSFSFRCGKPSGNVINFCAYETGLSVSVPCTSLTYVSRESMPVIANFAKKAGLWIYPPNGQIIEKPDGDQLHIMWTDLNRRTLVRMSLGNDTMPFYFPLEQTDAMWNYANARPMLSKRYEGRGIYVPRILLIRNKLSRNQVYRAIFWTDFVPTVWPDIDAVVLSKPGRLIFGRFPAGEPENVVVRINSIEELIEPCIKSVSRPFEHKIIEDASSVRLPIMRKLVDTLPPKYRNFETVNPEELVDVQA